jgi:hypothetical protein
MELEFAGGVTLERASESRAAILRRAPEWWRKLASQPLRSAAAAKATQSRGATIGWLAGCVAPGVAVPCFNHQDQQRRREQFTPACWASVFEQFRKATSPVTLRWGHDGATLATTEDLSLMLDVQPVIGLTFDARITDNRAGRLALDSMTKSGLAVSIAYKRGSTWTVERGGEVIRVVNDCVVDHVAVLPPSKTPAYPAARCFARRGGESACPEELLRDARIHAWRTLKAQQGL